MVRCTQTVNHLGYDTDGPRVLAVGVNQYLGGKGLFLLPFLSLSIFSCPPCFSRLPQVVHGYRRMRVPTPPKENKRSRKYSRIHSSPAVLLQTAYNSSIQHSSLQLLKEAYRKHNSCCVAPGASQQVLRCVMTSQHESFFFVFSTPTTLRIAILIGKKCPHFSGLSNQQGLAVYKSKNIPVIL